MSQTSKSIKGRCFFTNGGREKRVHFRNRPHDAGRAIVWKKAAGERLK